MLAGARRSNPYPLLFRLAAAVLCSGTLSAPAQAGPVGATGPVTTATTPRSAPAAGDAELHALAAAMINELRDRVAACGDPLAASSLAASSLAAASLAAPSLSAASLSGPAIAVLAPAGVALRGRPVLRFNPRLTAAAQRQAESMALSRQVVHRAADGTTVRERSLQAGYRWRVIGENLAAGQRSLAEVLAQWLASETHCDNLLDERFTEFGVARA
ncbi:MAG: CAP domain-containing protein, partial [Lautropia sp.]